MNNFRDYEDFLPDVRKSLYGESEMGVKSNESVHRKFKKVKFNTFNTDPNISVSNGSKSEKLKHRKNTPFKKKIKKEPLIEEEVDSGSHLQKVKGKHKHFRKKQSKKKQVVISFSSSSDSFDEELKDNQLTPSKSELEIFQNTINKSCKRKLSNMIGSSSDNDENESGDNFDLEMFFNTREMSELNESVTEAHSGIDHEFVSDFAKNVKIMESEPLYNQREVIKIEIDSVGESDKDVSEDSVCEGSTENVESVTDKIQEPVEINDENWKETSFSSFENDEQLQEEEHLKESDSTSPEECKNFQEEELSENYCAAEYYDVEDKKLVVLNENKSVSFYGLFTLKVLYGKVEVLGSILESNSSAVNLYSPRGSAFLYIRNVTHCQDSNKHIKINELFPAQGILEADIFAEANSAVVLCSKLEDTKLLFVEKYISQKIFPRLENGSAPQVIFEPTGNVNMIKQNSIWDEVLSSVNEDTKLMITGGKGVGKSTLLRFAINRLLSKFEKVRVLDLDPGQSEFTVPGCVSVVNVTEPVFGPNFTHLKQPNRSFLSNINVAQDPRAYLNCIKSVVSYLDTLEGDYPTLINYMGFVQGIGLNIVASAIKYVQPTGIIQICSKDHKKNFKNDLTYQVVKQNCTLFVENHKMYSDYLELKYKLYKVPAMNDESDGWTMEPRQSREMYVLAYFGQMMQTGVDSLTSHKLPMYEIDLSSIKIINLRAEYVAPAVVNANMVALCSLDPESNVFRCMGYGVVRGIDLESNKLVLITPEEITVLEDVYYLVMGSVFLPPALYISSDDVTGSVPYVMEGELVSLGQITKRSYLPANKK